MDSQIITVVTVCLNAEKIVRKTMTSVLGQTYPNIEYIIIDGASKDGTLQEINDVLGEFQQRQVVVKSEPDSGIYDAMNKAIDMATGEWINFMNAGDAFFDSEVISKLSPFLSGDYDVVFGNEMFVNGKRSKLKRGELKEGGFPSLGHQSTFVRTSLMKSHHFNMSYKISADFEFLYSMYKQNKRFYHIDEIINIFDMGGLSANHRALLYKEHCEIRGGNPSKLKMLKYMVEDALPQWMMNKLMAFFWYDK